jgi:sirohydrochlorin ferrochelatase
MKALIIVSHGSRIENANHEMVELAGEIGKLAESDFHTVRHAFLEFVEPSLEQQIENLMELGINRVVLFPLFLAAGKHVAVDLPRILEEAKQRYPEVGFELTVHLGDVDGLKEIILNEVMTIH